MPSSDQPHVAPPDTSPIAVFIRANPWVYGLVLVLVAAGIGYGIYAADRPEQGTWRYGVCRTLVEYEFAFPISFDVLSVAEERAGVRFFLAEKNPFGNERIVQVDCTYRIDGAKVSLASLAFDRREIPADRVAYYNRMLPVLLAMEDGLDKDLPKPLPRTLDQLKR